MTIWPCARRASRLITPGKLKRAFSTFDHERVGVRCGSAGHINVDLFNVSQHAPTSAFFIHLPPAPVSNASPPALPDFLQHWPVASINYRWGSQVEDDSPKPPIWPSPVHDVAIAFSWLAENLAPERNGRRDMYVYGSHLGAGLAASLALTEAHSHARFGVRGLVAYNGVYNWTMFLPDHRINRISKKTAISAPQPAYGLHLQSLEEQMPALFGTPANLFDPFASPSLLFHSPGLVVPKSFSMSTADASLVDALASKGTPSAASPIAPRKSHLVFPPRKSTLKIPETLLLHDSPSEPPRENDAGSSGRRSARQTASKRARGGSKKHTLAAQAQELAELMRRSIDKVELKERSKWDDDMDGWGGEEAMRRVQVLDVGGETARQEMSEAAQDTALEWLRDRV